MISHINLDIIIPIIPINLTHADSLLRGGSKIDVVGHFRSKNNTGKIQLNMLTTSCSGTGCCSGYGAACGS